jgi:hypothetical protein
MIFKTICPRLAGELTKFFTRRKDSLDNARNATLVKEFLKFTVIAGCKAKACHRQSFTLIKCPGCICVN